MGGDGGDVRKIRVYVREYNFERRAENGGQFQPKTNLQSTLKHVGKVLRARRENGTVGVYGFSWMNGFTWVCCLAEYSTKRHNFTTRARTRPHTHTHTHTDTHL